MRPGRLSPGKLYVECHGLGKKISFNEARAVKPWKTTSDVNSTNGKDKASMRPGRLSPGKQ